ncbi:MAG: hypothetical protein ACRELY_00155 [Polyangiaceae bacterium]
MGEYALMLFAVLLLGAAGIRKISPGLNTSADLTRRYLSGEDPSVTGNSVGGAVGNIGQGTAGSLGPNGDGNSVGGGGATSGGSNGSAGSGSGSAGQGVAGNGGSPGVGGGGSTLGGGTNVGSGATNAGASSPFASSAGSIAGSTGGAIADFFSSSSSAASPSSGSSSSSGSANQGKNRAKSLQSVMPPGLLGASGANEVNPPPGQGAVNGPGYSISAAGEQQMQALLARARRNVGNKRPLGKCYHQVKLDIQEVGYGSIPKQTANGQLRPLPGSDQGYAHDFADYMNARGANGQTNAQSLGLQKLPITNPYDAPPGSIIVVRAGTPGTRNPVAGDIVVAGGNGKFYNDGNMGYGGSKNFPAGNNYVLGIYAPR